MQPPPQQCSRTDTSLHPRGYKFTNAHLYIMQIRICVVYKYAFAISQIRICVKLSARMRGGSRADIGRQKQFRRDAKAIPPPCRNGRDFRQDFRAAMF